MKKVLVSLLIMSLLMTTALTAFAVPTINYAFKADDNTMYVFGKLGTNANEDDGEALATDYTLEVTDKDNNEFDIVVGDIDDEKIANIKAANLFGFGIKDTAGKLDDEFIVRPSFVAPSIIANNNDKQVKVYGEYFEVDPANATVTQLTNMSCEDISSDYDTGLAELNGAVNLKTGAVTYNNLGLTLSSLFSPVLKFDISYIPATAEKVTFSIGTNKSYTSSKAFLDDDYIMDVYKIDADILDKNWDYSSASSYSWDTMSSNAEGYKTIIDEANKIGSMTSADLEKVTYRENATGNITSSMTGVRVVVDITDAVVKAKAAGENTLSIAVVLAQGTNPDGAIDSTSTDANFYLRSLAYVSGTSYGARASKMIAPRIDYVK